jgi:hypothetical protein
MLSKDVVASGQENKGSDLKTAAYRLEMTCGYVEEEWLLP